MCVFFSIGRLRFGANNMERTREGKCYLHKWSSWTAPLYLGNSNRVARIGDNQKLSTCTTSNRASHALQLVRVLATRSDNFVYLLKNFCHLILNFKLTAHDKIDWKLYLTDFRTMEPSLLFVDRDSLLVLTTPLLYIHFALLPFLSVVLIQMAYPRETIGRIVAALVTERDRDHTHHRDEYLTTFILFSALLHTLTLLPNGPPPPYHVSLTSSVSNPDPVTVIL